MRRVRVLLAVLGVALAGCSDDGSADDVAEGLDPSERIVRAHVEGQGHCAIKDNCDRWLEDGDSLSRGNVDEGLTVAESVRCACRYWSEIPALFDEPNDVPQQCALVAVPDNNGLCMQPGGVWAVSE